MVQIDRRSITGPSPDRHARRQFGGAGIRVMEPIAHESDLPYAGQVWQRLEDLCGLPVALPSRLFGARREPRLQAVERYTIRSPDQERRDISAAGCLGIAGAQGVQLVIAPYQSLWRALGAKVAHCQPVKRPLGFKR